MKTAMRLASSQLTDLVETSQLTAGMYVRVHGDHLILGRPSRDRDDSEQQNDDRVRLTRLTASKYGLSVKRHTGRWERTAFSGTIVELFEVILSFMQHLVAAV